MWFSFTIVTMVKKANTKDTFTASQVGALIEDLRSEFRVFGDELKTVSTRLKAVEVNQARTLEKITSLEMRVTAIEVAIKEIRVDVAAIKNAIRSQDIRISHLETAK